MEESGLGQHATRDLVVDWREGDAEKLARLENAAQGEWPGAGARQVTPSEMERWIRHSDLLGAFVTEDGEGIISLCTLYCRPGQKEYCYIPHLVCHPDYQGRKHGKAVLGAAVEQACALGFGKVDLNTWSGNTKAVPLYKKMGFMWRPETSVLMESFVPAARRLPLAAPFFAAHDWYATLQRSLTLEEDLVWRGKVRVYEYRWEAPDGRFLRLVFDRQSWRLVEAETPALLVGCTLPAEELVAGTPHPVRWHLANRRPEPVRVFLTARGDAGVHVSHGEVLELQGDAERETTVVVDPDLPEKAHEPRAAGLATEALFGEERIELCAGAAAVQAVDVTVEAPRLILPFTRSAAARLTLTSHLDDRARVAVVVRALRNADLERGEHQLDLGPRGAGELAVRLCPRDPGPVSLQVQVWAETAAGRLPTRPRRLDFLALQPGGSGAAVGERTAVLCRGSLAVFASLHSGDVSLHHLPYGLRAHRLHLLRPRLGPPFSWEDLFQEKAECWVEGAGETLSLHLRSASVLHPGVVLERCLRVEPCGILGVWDLLLNGSGRPLSLERLQMYHMTQPAGVRTRLFAMRPDGVYGDPLLDGGRRLEETRLPPEASTWPEGWLCRQGSDGLVSGLLWGEASLVEVGPWGEVRQGGQVLGPGQSGALPALHAFLGDGTWLTVRRWWQALHGGGFPEDEATAPPVRAPLDLQVEPSPILLAGASANARVQLRTAGTVSLNGTLAARASPGLEVEVARTRVRGLGVDRPFATRVRVIRLRGDGTAAPEGTAGRAAAAAGPPHLQIRLDTEHATYGTQADVIPVPAPAAPVTVERCEGLFVLHNGVLRARVAPAFCGCLVSLSLRDCEFLNCAYPQACRRGWRNPWYGGAQPQYGRLPNRLHHERFRARRVQRRGGQGLRWTGVRLDCTVRQEAARGHAFSLEYLMAPGVPLLAVVLGRRDRLGTWTEGDVGINLWPAFADAPGTAVFGRSGPQAAQGRLGPQRSSGQLWSWGGLTGSDGRSLFVGGCSEGISAGGWAEGPEGAVLFAALSRPLPQGAQVRGLTFVAPAATVEEAEALGVWSRFANLP
ncbi:MAG: GNAT family N-acetyltransferase [Candidatus Latescibacterota bacterium]